jgi:hypothetical protein
MCTIASDVTFDAARRRIDRAFPEAETAARRRSPVWRRVAGIDAVKPTKLEWAIVSSAFTLNPISFLPGDDWNLRSRILRRLALESVEANGTGRRTMPSETEAPA